MGIFDKLTEKDLLPIADRWNDDGMRKPVIAKNGERLTGGTSEWGDMNMYLPKFLFPGIEVSKNGRMNTLEKPKEHKMIKHSSPLAQDEHGLYQHNLYSAVQHIGFGIKSYV